MSTDHHTRTGTAPYTQSIDGCLEGAIGKHGLTPAELGRWLEPLAPALAALQEDYRTRRLPHLRIAEETADVAEAEAALARLSAGADTIVFFGIGGSSLGGQTLAQLGGWNIPGMANEAQRRRPRTRFYDNLDPVTLQSALATFDLAATRFVITSKSGGTPETLVQALAALAAVKERGPGERAWASCSSASPSRPCPARPTACARCWRRMPSRSSITIRASAGATRPSPTSACCRPWRAASMPAPCAPALSTSLPPLMAAKAPREFAPALGAAIAVALARERGIRALVMMPYADRLGRLGHWFAQLWAESLGKNGQGTAPISCLGPVDHHSQLQLFMDGPREYLVSIVRAPSAGLGPRMSPELATAAGLDYLAGRTAGDLVAAQAVAVPEALLRAGRPVRTFDLARLDEQQRRRADDAFRAGDDSRRAPHGRRPLRPAGGGAGQGHHARAGRGATQVAPHRLHRSRRGHKTARGNARACALNVVRRARPGPAA